MAVVRVTHGIDDLVADLRLIPRTMKVRGKAVVRRNVDSGAIVTRQIAKKAAGPHGANYFKRIKGEMTGGMSGEYGPSPLVGLRYVGVSGSAGAMRDLDKSLERVRPKFHRDVERMVDSLFWPGGDQ